jgi:hypothetical protein
MLDVGEMLRAAFAFRNGKRHADRKIIELTSGALISPQLR